MSFAYTPDYVFESSTHDSTHDNFGASADMRVTYGINKISISGSFLDIHFDGSTQMADWRAQDRSVVLEHTGSGAKSWEGTFDLTSSEEYSVNTTYSYIHYDLSAIFGNYSDGPLIADDVAQAGLLSNSVLTMTFE